MTHDVPSVVLQRKKITNLCLLTEISVVILIFNALHQKQDDVFTQICMHQTLKDLLGITKNEDAIQRWLFLYSFKNTIHIAILTYIQIGDVTGDIDSSFYSEWNKA